MKWAHLPNAGGLYDQDPDLLDRFEYIFGALNQKEAEEIDRNKKEADKVTRNAKLGKSGAGSPRSTRVRNR